YRESLHLLDGVWRLDPGNVEATELHNRANDQLRLLSHSADADWPAGILAQGSRRPEIVLIVDQDPRVRSGLLHSLRDYGFLCVGAEGYEEAMEAVSYCQPSVVLSEVNFADGPRGFDLFRELKNARPKENLVFIFMVANVAREVEIAGRRLGVDDFLRKPFDNEIVATLIMRSLYRHQRAI
ncbi:MAG: response regulator, partial [Bacteroidota bacterium]